MPVDSADARDPVPGGVAVGDVATAGMPKAGVFAEGAARIVAQTIIAKLRGGAEPGPHLGRGTCYIEFGSGRVGSVDIDFLSGPIAQRNLQRAIGRSGRRKGTLRLESPRPLVRFLTEVRRDRITRCFALF